MQDAAKATSFYIEKMQQPSLSGYDHTLSFTILVKSIIAGEKTKQTTKNKTKKEKNYEKIIR